MKGEFIIVIEPNATKKESNDDIKTIEKLYKLQGLEKKEIIKKIAKDKNVAKNEIYQYFIEKKLP